MSEMKMITFLGKGGVGKTTLSVVFANMIQDKRVLVISLDQQNNHRDLIEHYNLDLDYRCLEDKAMDDLRDVLVALGFGKYNELLDVIGRDFVLILQLAYFVYDERDKYDVIVVDFPPNTASINLFSIEDVTDSLFFKVLTIKNRIKRLLKGKDETLEKVEDMKRRLDTFGRLFKGGCNIIVGTPDFLGLLEAKKLLVTMRKYQINPSYIVVNMISGDSPLCRICHHRFVSQDHYVKEFEEFAKKNSLKLVKLTYVQDPINNLSLNELIGC